MTHLRFAALAALLVASVVAAGADAPAPQVVADFETAEYVDGLEPEGSKVERVELAKPAVGHALRWTIAAGEAYVALPAAATPDLVKNRFLTFRIRLDGAKPGSLDVRVESKGRAWIGATVRGVGADWKTMTYDVEQMQHGGKFDPAAVGRVWFVVDVGKAGGYQIDDVAFTSAAPPVSEDAKKGRTLVADFETPESMDFVESHRSAASRLPAGPKEKAHWLSWTMEAGGKTAYMELYGLPRDVRGVRSLKFRARADRAIAEAMTVRLEAGSRDYLDGEVASLGKEWKQVELRLPDMNIGGEFDPRRVEDVSFIFFKPQAATVEIDDVELVAGPGGWRLTEAEQTAKAFGEARVKKAAKIATKHFEIHTDSAAAEGKFPKALEEEYEFVKKLLELPEMDEPLPIYVFQNSQLYFDFCVRYAGWTKSEAEDTAGHGSGRYFATYYQSADAPTIVHELTHSLFIRAYGAQGGSWFHEGVAMYVENAWQHRSAAEQFATNLRSGQFVPLAEFLAMERLVSEHDTKGGPRTASRLYDQAGAFYEFLLRGPFAPEMRNSVPVIARTRKDDKEQPAFLALLFGRKLEEIEKEWIAWGSDPPKEGKEKGR